jgi:molybdopterin synthase sulfur carrier subunit
MAVELRFFATIREAVGQRRMTRELESDASVRHILAALEDEYPALDGRLLDEESAIANVTVLHNGTNVTHFEGGATEVADGDTLSITLPVTGG